MKRTALGLALLAALPSVPALAQSAPAGDSALAVTSAATTPQPEAQRIAALEARIAALEAEVDALRGGSGHVRAGTVIGSAPVVAAGNAAPAAPDAAASGDDFEALAADAGDDTGAVGGVAA